VLPEVGSNTDVIADALLARDRMDKFRYPRDPVCGHYLGYLEDRPDQGVGGLRSVAHAGGAAVVHCAAGKDRTGVVVALRLPVAGGPARGGGGRYCGKGRGGRRGGGWPIPRPRASAPRPSWPGCAGRACTPGTSTVSPPTCSGRGP